jgi:hypothetical protein
MSLFIWPLLFCFFLSSLNLSGAILEETYLLRDPDLKYIFSTGKVIEDNHGK